MIITASYVHNIVLGTSIAVRVPSAATRALARVASWAVGTDCTSRTGISNAFVNVNAGSTKLSRCSCETLCTQTLGYIIDDHALGVRRTGHSFARMAAVITDIRFRAQTPLVLIADGISGTVIIAGASHDGNTTDPWIGIRDRSRGTCAIERTGQIVAHGTLAARVWFGALIQIRAESLRISCESGRTLTRVSSRYVLANRIVSTLPRWTVDRVALVNVHAARCYISRVKCPALLAHAVSFHAVRFAVGVRATGDVFTGGFAFDTWRCSDISGEAVALERPRSVDALSVGSANTCSRPALVYVHADGTIRLESVLAEALSIHALCVICAVKVCGAMNGHIALDAA